MRGRACVHAAKSILEAVAERPARVAGRTAAVAESVRRPVGCAGRSRHRAAGGVRQAAPVAVHDGGSGAMGRSRAGAESGHDLAAHTACRACCGLCSRADAVTVAAGHVLACGLRLGVARASVEARDGLVAYALRLGLYILGSSVDAVGEVVHHRLAASLGLFLGRRELLRSRLGRFLGLGLGVLLLALDAVGRALGELSRTVLGLCAAASADCRSKLWVDLRSQLTGHSLKLIQLLSSRVVQRLLHGEADLLGSSGE